MKLYLLGARSLARAEGISREEAQRIWISAHEAIVYDGAGRLGTVFVVAIGLLTAGLFVGFDCDTGPCRAVELLGVGAALLMMPIYMLVAVSRRCRKLLQTTGRNPDH